MITPVPGENTDIYINGELLHIQTEDWGLREAALITRVFKNGAVIKTFKLPYAKIVSYEQAQNRRKSLLHLHQFVIDKMQG